MNSSVPNEKADELERAVRIAQNLKSQKFKGELVLQFDGSGKVVKIKKSEYV
jgi:uncharacterized protein (AIM24 family)